MTDISEFRIDIDDAELIDLRSRLTNTRWGPALPGAAWERGVPVDFLRDLADYWATKYDWRAAESALNAYPQFTTVVDGQKIHFLHVRSGAPDALPLVLLHGWPGSVVEFLDVIGPLTTGPEPFDLVIPSLPGFGFSGPLAGPGWDSRRMATALASVMSRLGYDRYGAQGGDFGAFVAPDLGRVDAAHVVGVHVNAATVGFIPFGEAGDLTAAEQVRYERMQRFQSDGNGYFQIQATRPQTLAHALVDSPVGQLAWIAEKFQEWSHDGFPDRDRVLTDVTLYWLTRTAGSAANMYYESMHSQNWPTRSEVPTGVANFAEDVAIRRYAEQTNNIVHWSEFDTGGHFAAIEVPELLVEDIRTFFRALR
ncbi:epoxide hydrolase family protein [Paractinoplanes lichenicola]|uniref:Epoxide hydrolase n=1 Tax=Paractinoplanes lichenicola TaxID=2802976 RepID=A0ABS1VSX5_9ACTN|nr:epoxide hydrolase family protein [Actinoplanes lichenicola]MBL7257569.1 epoxide hydrolase [Actinoplanes lichenicola]